MLILVVTVHETTRSSAQCLQNESFTISSVNCQKLNDLTLHTLLALRPSGGVYIKGSLRYYRSKCTKYSSYCIAVRIKVIFRYKFINLNIVNIQFYLMIVHSQKTVLVHGCPTVRNTVLSLK